MVQQFMDPRSSVSIYIVGRGECVVGNTDREEKRMQENG